MGYLRLVRPVNCVITGASVLVGAWVGKTVFWSMPLFWAALAGSFVCGFGNCINDIMDVNIDRLNNPRRPLVSGAARRGQAIIMTAALAAAGLAAAVLLGPYPLMIVAFALIMLFLYAVALKRTIVANLVVALIAGLSFILGGFVSANWFCLIPFVFALFIHLPREIVKDVIDIEGDRGAGVNSLPIAVGTEKALRIGAISLIMLCLAVPVPFIFKILNLAYLVLIVVGSFPLLLIVVTRLLKIPNYKELVLISKLLKVAMGVGLLGFVLG